MILMHTLKMMADLCFYGAFAGYFCAKYTGGSWLAAGLLFLSLCYGISHAGGDSRGKRAALALPSAAVFLAADSAAGLIFFLPAEVWLLSQVWNGEYVLSSSRQTGIFSVFWKAVLIFFCIVSVFGDREILSESTIPLALMMLTASIFLMRALRQEPTVYCKKSYQLANGALLAVLLLACAVLSSDLVVGMAVSGLKQLYYLIMIPLTWLLMAVVYGLSKLATLLPLPRLSSSTEEITLNLSELSPIEAEEGTYVTPAFLQWGGTAVLIASAVAILYFFFRWLRKKRGNDGIFLSGTAEKRESVFTEAGNEAAKGTSIPDIRRIRSLYRKYLRYCTHLGILQKPADTSLDISRQEGMLSGSQEASDEIRQIYIQARYGQRADRESVKRMKELCSHKKKKNL